MKTDTKILEEKLIGLVGGRILIEKSGNQDEYTTQGFSLCGNAKTVLLGVDVCGGRLQPMSNSKTKITPGWHIDLEIEKITIEINGSLTLFSNFGEKIRLLPP